MKSSRYYQDQKSDFSRINNKKAAQKSQIQSVESKNKKQLLCKISFQIDGEQEELFIYQNATLEQITNQLLEKIMTNGDEEDKMQEKVSLEQRQALKDEIKSKIQMTMECCIDKNAKTQKWKKKLRQIIEQKSFMHIQSLSQCGTKRCLQQNSSTSIKYFNYNFFNRSSQKQMSSIEMNGQQKSIEIINRAKKVQNLLTNKLQKRELVQHSYRLYQLSKRNKTIKSEIIKMREEYEEKQMFSECTFHPKIQKLKLNHAKPDFKHAKDESKSVFKRLYKEALEKQQMSKIIEKKINERHEQQFKKFNFIPKINQCSNEIATLKKKLHQRHGISIYQSLYQEGNKKAKEPQINKNLTFHPKLCKASEKMIQKSRSTKTMLKNLFSPKENSLMKTQTYAEDQIQAINIYEKLTINKQKNCQNKNISRFMKNKQNIVEDFSLCKIDNSKNVSSFNNSKNFNNKEDNLETNLSILSFSTNSKTTRQKQRNFHHSINQVCSHQQIVSQSVNTVQQNFTDKKSRNKYSSNHLKSLSKRDENSLRQLDINKSKNQEKQLKKRQRLNPFQFFKLEETKKQKNNTNFIPQIEYSRKKPFFNQISKQLKNKIFSNIFRLLNNMRGEQIYYESIYKCQGIPIHIKKILYPMAEQMQQLNVGLDEQEFIWSLARISQNLNQKDQEQLMEWGKQLDFSNQIGT